MFEWFKNRKLPSWAKLAGTHGVLQVVRVDTHAAYPWVWEQLRACCQPGDPECPPEHPDQDDYWLEVAYQCIKLELQRCMGRMDFEIHMKDPGKRWKQRDPNGPRAKAAAQGRGARRCYFKLRGAVPGAERP